MRGKSRDNEFEIVFYTVKDTTKLFSPSKMAVQQDGDSYDTAKKYLLLRGIKLELPRSLVTLHQWESNVKRISSYVSTFYMYFTIF